MAGVLIANIDTKYVISHIRNMKVDSYIIPRPDVTVYRSPMPEVNVYRLCSTTMNLPLAGQQFEADEDVGIRLNVSTTDRNESIANTIVILKIYDNTTTPETFIVSKDNGDAANPAYNGGGKIVQITSERLTLDFVLTYDGDLSSLPAGQRTLSYEIYLVDASGRRCFRGKGQFTRKAA